MSFKDLFRACACEVDTHEDTPNLSELSTSASNTRVYDQLVIMHYNLGCSLQEQGKLDEAINCYRNALEVDRTYCDAQYNLANALQLAGRVNEAEAEYRKTISLNPRHQLAYYNLGYIYFNDLKDPWKGIEMLKKSLEIDPTDIDAQINMALALNDLGLIDDVIKCYQYIIEHNGTCVMAHFNLGNAYLDAGDVMAAFTSFQVNVSSYLAVQ
jgi:tetratricopeptide (TPR) repeat protein